MAVLVVFIHTDGEVGGLRAAFGVDGGRFGVLLRHEGRGRELSELQFGLDTEEGRAAAYERRAGGHGHVAGLD